MATDSPPMDNISAQLSLKTVWQPGSDGIYGEFIAMCSHPSCFAAGKEARVRGRWRKGSEKKICGKRKRIERNAGEGKVRQERNGMEGERRREKSREAERKEKGTVSRTRCVYVLVVTHCELKGRRDCRPAGPVKVIDCRAGHVRSDLSLSFCQNRAYASDVCRCSEKK